MANRESSTSWKEFLLGLKRLGLRGVFFAVSDDHPGLKRAITEALPEAYWQRCYVHFLRNALDYLPHKVADDCLVELRWLYDRRNAEEARRDLAAWLLRWQEKYPRLCAWVEENIALPLYFRHYNTFNVTIGSKLRSILGRSAAHDDWDFRTEPKR
jgi:transposase-like protein